VFTAVLPGSYSREFDRRLVLGMSDVCGGAILVWRPVESGRLARARRGGRLLVLGAGQQPHAQDLRGDSVKIAGIKGLAAGTVKPLRGGGLWCGAAGTADRRRRALIGCSAMGLALPFRCGAAAARHRENRRLFSTAPFIGVAASFALLGEAPDASFWVASVLMAAGVALHLTERHRHLPGTRR